MPVPRIITDLLQGADGAWEIGRIQSWPVLATGLWVIIDIHLYARSQPSMMDLGVGLAGVAGATLMMLKGGRNPDGKPGLMSAVVERVMPVPAVTDTK